MVRRQLTGGPQEGRISRRYALPGGDEYPSHRAPQPRDARRSEVLDLPCAGGHCGQPILSVPDQKVIHQVVRHELMMRDNQDRFGPHFR
jgi:hypothetical protein